MADVAALASITDPASIDRIYRVECPILPIYHPPTIPLDIHFPVLRVEF
jgi:hypothetical protein